MNRPGIGTGDLVALTVEGKRMRGVVIGSPISGTVQVGVRSRPRPVYLATSEVELLVSANYDINAENPERQVEIAIIVRDGLVESIRSNASINATVVDLDTLDDCNGDEEGLCLIDETDDDREDHARTREKFESAQMLPLEAVL